MKSETVILLLVLVVLVLTFISFRNTVKMNSMIKEKLEKAQGGNQSNQEPGSQTRYYNVAPYGNKTKNINLAPDGP